LRASRRGLLSGLAMEASLVTLLFVLLAYPDPALSSADEFRFPLLIPPALTSTFCEYRSGHFHSGIDLSTQAETGQPVVAVRSGYVYRVRASGVGYGKAVYLLLDNGMFAVYGHLESFSEKIQSFVLSRQIESERYEVDIFPLPFQLTVEKGEILGYSGNSGSSSGPHLHFELRRGDKAVNPLAGFFPLEEHVSPTFRFVRLTPLGAGSEVDDRHRPGTLPVGSGDGGRTYGCSAEPRVAGRFFVSASVFDRTENALNKLAVYGVKLFLDDSLLFANRFEEVEFSRTHEVELAYDRGLAARGETYTLNLCRFEGSRSSLFRRMRAGAGVIDTDSLHLTGLHTLRIEASDIAGNTSSAVVRLNVNRRPRVSRVNVDRYGDILLVTAEAEDPDGRLEAVWLDYRLGALGAEPVLVAMDQETAVGPREGIPVYSAEVRLPSELAALGEDELAGILRVVARDSSGAASSPYTEVLKGTVTVRDATAELLIRLGQRHAEILARVSPFFVRPRIGVARDDTLWLDVQETSEGLYEAYYGLERSVSDGALVLCVLDYGGARPLVLSRPLGVWTARKGRQGTVWSENDRAGFAYGPETFYEDTHLSLKVRGRGGPPAKGLTFASDVLSVEPEDVVFDKKGHVIIRCDSTQAVSDRIAVYCRTHAGGKWGYVGAVVDTLQRTVSAGVRRFCEFALLKDESPPSILIVRPVMGSVYRTSRPPLYATVKDVGSGVTWHGAEVSIDGKKSLSIWDPKISRLSVEHHQALSPGRHVVTFEVTDRAGNTARASSHFWIEG
jgi:hypothetical protein